MAGRPPLPIGAHGKIHVTQLQPRLHRARCRHRDYDGVTRIVERTGKSASAARNNLQQALTERRNAAGAGATITGETRLRVVVEMWLDLRRAEVEAGDLSTSTIEVYESAWRNNGLEALGELRIRECTVSRLETWKVALRKAKGAAATKSARTVVSGALAYAVRLTGALSTNPVRDISAIPGLGGKPARALTREERTAWLEAMEASERAMRWDIPDLTRMMLATGARIGEAMAVSWDEVDFEAKTVAIRWHLVPVRGEGLRREPGAKSMAGDRVVAVPSWCIDMLMRRRTDPDSGWPVFPDMLGGWRWPGNVGRVLREERAKAGFGWVTSHVFRKTVLTILDEAGTMSPRQIADVAGHADPAMTQRAYLQRGIVVPEAAAALEDLW